MDLIVAVMNIVLGIFTIVYKFNTTNAKLKPAKTSLG